MLRQPSPLASPGLEVLETEGDPYDGVLVNAGDLPVDAEQFSERLQHSLQTWTENKRKGIWLKIPLSHAELVAAAAQHGFVYHHAEPTYVMMTRWLPQTENKLPAHSTHQVGIGAFVMNERREVLMVQERTGPLRGKGMWKLPTGLVNVGEDIRDAAEREVAEETGVSAEFRAVLAIRQSHGFLHGKSDLFFGAALEPKPGQDELRIQEDELEAACWMPMQEFVENPAYADRPVWREVMRKCVAYADGEYSGLTTIGKPGGYLYTVA